MGSGFVNCTSGQLHRWLSAGRRRVPPKAASSGQTVAGVGSWFRSGDPGLLKLAELQLADHVVLGRIARDDIVSDGLVDRWGRFDVALCNERS